MKDSYYWMEQIRYYIRTSESGVRYSFFTEDDNDGEGGNAMGYILCLIGGACLGVITMSLMVAAGDEDEKREM